MHGAAIVTAGATIWQAVLLGMWGVMLFACPMWYNPLIWVLVGALAHIINVTTSRLCLEGHHRWSWDLSVISGLEIRWAWVMHMKDMVLTILALADYVYGTAILSSTQLVGPQPALKIAVALTLPAIFAKLVSIILLGLGPRDHKYSIRQEHTCLRYCSFCDRALVKWIPNIMVSNWLKDLLVEYQNTVD
ncbi:hypothetical protein B0H14DRAFT_3647641 [Mycena olivaceomarginata]|nr:hypothetical protein B0H14DRAFT_3647641 [Mycena olivaceomarginata]